MCKKHFNINTAKWLGTLLLGTMTLTACNDFLDVRPKSEKVEDELLKLPTDSNRPSMASMAHCKRAQPYIARTSIGALPTVWHKTSTRIALTTELDLPNVTTTRTAMLRLALPIFGQVHTQVSAMPTMS